MTFTDEELVRYVRAEFDRVGSQFFGYNAWATTIKLPEGRLTRVVVADQSGRTMLTEAPTEAEGRSDWD